MGCWVPIISQSSDAGLRAQQIVRAISERVLHEQADSEEAFLHGRLPPGGSDDSSLSLAVERLNLAIGQADALCSTGRFGLHGGLAGLGWAVEQLSRELKADQDDDLNEDTDAALVRELERGRWGGTCDLETGLAGIGVYFLYRCSHDLAAGGLVLVIDHLESLSRPAGPGALWPSDFALDAARGIPGLIHFLLHASFAGIKEEKVRRLLDESIEWLVHKSQGARRATWSDSLGTAAVCFQVARHLGRSDCLELGEKIVERCLSAPPDAAAASGMSLRHGAAGVAHSLNRIYQSEGNDRCREMALSWFDRAIESPLPPEGSDMSLLDGAIGVALALLSAFEPVEPVWDRRMLLSAIEPDASPAAAQLRHLA